MITISSFDEERKCSCGFIIFRSGNHGNISSISMSFSNHFEAANFQFDYWALHILHKNILEKKSLFAHFFESFLPGRDLSITRWMRMCVEEMESFCYNSDENEIIGNNRGRGNAQIQWVLSPHFMSNHSCSARELTADQSSLTINQSSSFSFVYNDTVCVCMFVDLQHVPKKNNNRIHLIYDQQLNSHQQFIYDYR